MNDNKSNEEKRKKGITIIEQWLNEVGDSVACKQGDNKSDNEKPNFNSWESLPDTLTALHISEFLHISRRRVYELFQLDEEEGDIANFQIGASKRVEKQDFKKWISNKKITHKQTLL